MQLNKIHNGIQFKLRGHLGTSRMLFFAVSTSILFIYHFRDKIGGVYDEEVHSEDCPGNDGNDDPDPE